MTPPTCSSPGTPAPHHDLPWTSSLQIGSLGLEPLPSHLPPGEPHPVQGLAPGMALTEAQALLQSSRYRPARELLWEAETPGLGEEGPGVLCGQQGIGCVGIVRRLQDPRVETPLLPQFSHHPRKPRTRSRSHACGPLSALSLILFDLGHRTGQAASTSILGSLEKPVGAS